MSVIALLNAFCYVHAHDFTADSNALTFSGEAAENDATTFRSQGWKTLGPGGLRSGVLNMGGFWQSASSDAVDPITWNDLAVPDRVMTFGPIETEGNPAYMWQGAHYQYQLGGAGLGELAPYSLEGHGSNSIGVVRGRLAAAMQVKAATGVLGSALQLGAVGAAQYLYATLHVLGTPGTTITVQLQSDDNAGFTSATTRATLGPITTAGGTWMPRVAGAITDDYYRFNISAVTGSFTLAGAIGVQ
ncbi:hypothetical protein [Sphaerisporangium sp. TRM90804]|uniref:hypothetical protein n=1 Tax=Sphaerisporangium sp. TRM90804 TaxID=3031113 RepID=UPI0024470D8F|nr:hypothetical protein [Sphaerisporangium sp. TRM90804]MDH2425784.1 hypothetical protein [Sphaerisporangium sp. TRM90804]